MSYRIRVQPTKIDLRAYADAQFKKNARVRLRRASDVLLKHVKFQLLRRRGPQPSAPGEPPAAQTGRLAKSFKRLRVRLRRGYGSAGVTSDEKRAYVMEYGEARHGRVLGDIAGKKGRRFAGRVAKALSGFSLSVYRVAPRPYLKPAAEEAEDEITDILRGVLEG